MTLLIGAWTVGLILSLLALGVFISFRVFKFPDITTEGSITLGAATAAVLLVDGVPASVATAAGFAAGPSPALRPACCTPNSASTACSPGSSS